MNAYSIFFVLAEVFLVLIILNNPLQPVLVPQPLNQPKPTHPRAHATRVIINLRGGGLENWQPHV